MRFHPNFILGQTSQDMVEVKTGLFEGDLVVTIRAPQLYAQSLRSGSKASAALHKEAPAQATKEVKTLISPVPWWVGVAGGAALSTVAFMTGVFWSGRRTKPQQVPRAAEFGYVPEESPNGSAKALAEAAWDDNHHVSQHRS